MFQIYLDLLKGFRSYEVKLQSAFTPKFSAPLAAKP